MVTKIDPRTSPEQFLSFTKELVNSTTRTPPVANQAGLLPRTRTPQIEWELRGFKRTASGNTFLAVNPLAVCVQETFQYLEESMGMRNVPLTHFITPLSQKDAEINLPKLVDKHNSFLEHFGLAVAAYWRAKAQRLQRLDPTRRVMERKLDMQIEANEVANFRDIVRSGLNVSGWNPRTKLLSGRGIELLYPNAEGMLSLGRTREVVVDLTPAETNELEQGDIQEGGLGVDDPVGDGAAGNLEEEPVAVGMWGAL